MQYFLSSLQHSDARITNHNNLFQNAVLFAGSHVKFNHSWHSCVLEEKGTGIFLFYPHVGKETEKLGIIKKVLPKSCNHKITGFAAGEEKVTQHCRIAQE
jgi:hypothetical protein